MKNELTALVHTAGFTNSAEQPSRTHMLHHDQIALVISDRAANSTHIAVTPISPNLRDPTLSRMCPAKGAPITPTAE